MTVSKPATAKVVATKKAPTQAQLVAYAYATCKKLRSTKISVNIGSAATPDLVNVSTRSSDVTAAVQLPSIAAALGKTAPASYAWINDMLPGGRPGAQLTLSAAQMMTIQYAITSYLQGTRATLGAVLDAIVAKTITTRAEIVAPPSPIAWPATSF